MIKPNQITSEYIHSLQACYHHITKRGIHVSLSRLEQAKDYIKMEITKELNTIAKLWGCHVYVGAANDDGTANSVNLNASSGSRTPLLKMKDLGYKIPKVPSRDEDGNYIAKESLGELTLQKMLSLNQFKTPGGDPSIKALLNVRELNTLRTRYVNADLCTIDNLPSFISYYNCAGTLTGRRGSKQHVFGYGGNGQNFPKHGVLAKIYRRCLIARPGTIFLMVDQMQAEDWPVSALAGNTAALDELQTGVDRHTKLASMIFNIPVESRTEKEWKDSRERFLGKKTRHARNYGMRGGTMSDSLAKEGISLDIVSCQALLDSVGLLDPSVDEVFHKYVINCINTDRILKNPFGRERQFFGLRPGDAGGNTKVFNEAFSWIPQGTVGDNTGFTVYDLETKYEVSERKIIQEGHDSIVQEIPCNVDSLWDYIQRTIKSGDRVIRMYNGIEFNIPWESEISFDFYSTVTLKSKSGSKKLTDLTYQDVQVALYKLKAMQELELEKDRLYGLCS